MIAAARNHPDAFSGTRVWLDVGDRDPFLNADTLMAHTLRQAGIDLSFHVGHGGHEGSYWRRNWPRYLSFYADALARCHT